MQTYSPNQKVRVPAVSGEKVRGQIKDAINTGIFPIFGYPLINFNEDVDDMHPAYNPQSGWKFISKSILNKGKPGDEVSPTGPGIRFLEEMISTYRLRHLEDEILQEDFTKGVPLGDKRKLYHRLEKQANGDYIAVRQDGSSLKVKQPHASSNMMEAIKYHFLK